MSHSSGDGEEEGEAAGLLPSSGVTAAGALPRHARDRQRHPTAAAAAALCAGLLSLAIVAWVVQSHLAGLRAELSSVRSDLAVALRAALPHPRLPELERCAADAARHAFIFYGLNPSLELLSFAIDLSEHTSFGVFVVADNTSFAWAAEAAHPLVRVIRITQDTAIDARFTHFGNGYGRGTTPQQATMAMDKAMLIARVITQYGDSSPPLHEHEPPLLADVLPHLCRTYCRAWLIEDDALIPSVQAAVHVNARTAVADLVSPRSFSIDEDPRFFWWLTLSEYPDFPGLPPRARWRHSMANAVAMSSHYCRLVEQFARRHGRLMYSETWLVTMAREWGVLALEAPNELRTEWRTKGGGKTVTADEQWAQAPSLMAWFHPVKDRDTRLEVRQQASLDRGQCRTAGNYTRPPRAARTTANPASGSSSSSSPSPAGAGPAVLYLDSEQP